MNPENLSDKELVTHMQHLLDKNKTSSEVIGMIYEVLHRYDEIITEIDNAIRAEIDHDT